MKVFEINESFGRAVTNEFFDGYQDKKLIFKDSAMMNTVGDYVFIRGHDIYLEPKSFMNAMAKQMDFMAMNKIVVRDIAMRNTEFSYLSLVSNKRIVLNGNAMSLTHADVIQIQAPYIRLDDGAFNHCRCPDLRLSGDTIVAYGNPMDRMSDLNKLFINARRIINPLALAAPQIREINFNDCLCTPETYVRSLCRVWTR